MLSGFNTDCSVGGKVFHVQTEDNGLKNPTIVTLVYQGGAIVASKKTSYADILAADCLSDVVRELMEEQHRSVISDIKAGRLGQPSGEGAKGGFGEDVISDKSLDEVVLGYLLKEEGEDTSKPSDAS
ncbi:MAG: hypothetical protein HYR98_03960 [Nitrospirae bacterium]|nr:hypothetical protein [Nitrospirota bacterium]MBI3393453.1 hypothetical protein [Nitrospirota bacterium]